MISASTCRQIVELSDATVDKILERLSPKVEAAATAGKRTYSIYEDGLWEGVNVTFGASPKPTPLQLRVIEKLKAHGFLSAKLSADGDKYIPRGLADDFDGTGPDYQNFCIVISW